MIQPIFIIDNRQVSCRQQSFEMEAAFASYHHHVGVLIAKYVCLTAKHIALSTPLCIGFAQTPDKVQYLCLKSYNLRNLHSFLEAKFSCVGGPNIPPSTWRRFLVDGIQKAGDIIKKQTNTGIVAPTYVICLYSTDTCLLGNDDSVVIDEDIKEFCQSCKKLSQFAKIVVRVVCTVVFHVQSELYSNKNLSVVHSTAREYFQDNISFTFHQLLNTSIHFGEELRMIMRLCCTSHLISVNFPSLHNIQCSLVLELLPSTVLSADFVQQRGFADPELYSLVPRDSVDPVCLNGYCLTATCPSYEKSSHICISRAWHHQNYLAFQSLMRYLATNDTILILKFPHMVQDSQFWALIPPSNPLKEEKNECTLEADSYLKIGNDGEDSKQMTLISLVDRDDIIAHNTNDFGSLSSSTRAKGEVAADAEDDVCTMDEFQKYFHDSLISALGPPSPYNPFASPSRKLDALLEQMSRNQQCIGKQVSEYSSSDRGVERSANSSARSEHVPSRADNYNDIIVIDDDNDRASRPSNNLRPNPQQVPQPQQQQQQQVPLQGGVTAGRGRGGRAGRGGRGPPSVGFATAGSVMPMPATASAPPPPARRSSASALQIVAKDSSLSSRPPPAIAAAAAAAVPPIQTQEIAPQQQKHLKRKYSSSRASNNTNTAGPTLSWED